MDNPEQFFFREEKLSRISKEYWFNHFISLDGRQIFIMFGHVKKRNLKLNKVKMEKEDMPWVVSIWYLDKKKIIIPVENCSISFEKKKILGKNTSVEFEISGEYPDFSIIIKKGRSIIINLKTGENKIKVKKELKKVEKFGAGYKVNNLFLDFKGVLAGKEINGLGLMQKVFLNIPFVPWNWLFINLNDNSFIEGFLPYFSILKRKKTIRQSIRFVSENKIIQCKKVNFEKKDGVYFINSRDKNKTISIILKPYGDNSYYFEGLGNFTYNQFLCRLVDLQISTNNLNLTLKDLKKGAVGMVEETEGIMI